MSEKGQPAELAIRAAGKHSIRITLTPIGFDGELPATPALAERDYSKPAIRLRAIDAAWELFYGRLVCRA